MPLISAYYILEWSRYITVIPTLFLIHGAVRFWRPSTRQLQAYAAMPSLPFSWMGYIAAGAAILGISAYFFDDYVPVPYRFFVWAIPWNCFSICALVAWVAATRTFFLRLPMMTYTFKRESATVLSLHVSLPTIRRTLRKVIGSRAVTWFQAPIKEDASSAHIAKALLEDIRKLAQTFKSLPSEVEYVAVMSPWFADGNHRTILNRLKQGFLQHIPLATIAPEPESREMGPLETWYVMTTSAQAAQWERSLRTDVRGRRTLKTAGFLIKRPPSGW